VLVAKAEQADVPIELRALGAVEPVQSSPVRPQITGTVTEVAFREGDMVRAGQVLFRLDRRPLEATLRQLEANLARDEAQGRSAEAQAQSAEAQVRNAEA
jgi:multidrug efflux system membrane fusion protein